MRQNGRLVSVEQQNCAGYREINWNQPLAFQYCVFYLTLSIRTSIYLVIINVVIVNTLSEKVGTSTGCLSIYL